MKLCPHCLNLVDQTGLAFNLNYCRFCGSAVNQNVLLPVKQQLAKVPEKKLMVKTDVLALAERIVIESMMTWDI